MQKSLVISDIQGGAFIWLDGKVLTHLLPVVAEAIAVLVRGSSNCI